MKLSESQRRFIALHQRHLVTKWQHLMQGSTIRATANVLSSTISLGELEQLFAFGLMQPGHGYGVALTDAGKAFE